MRSIPTIAGLFVVLALAPGACAQGGFANVGLAEQVLTAYLEATSANSDPFLSLGDEDAADSASYQAPDAGPASGALLHPAYYSNGAPQAFTFPAKVPLGHDLYLNLSSGQYLASAGIRGTIWWTAVHMTTAGQENGRLRAEVFLDGLRVGGEDVYYSTPLGTSASPGWNQIRLDFHPEIGILHKGGVLSVKITRFQGLADFTIGTRGAQQSFVEFHYFESDPLAGTTYLQNGQLRVDATQGTATDADPSPAAPLALIAFALLARPWRVGRRRLALIACVLLMAGPIAGCVGGRPAGGGAASTAPGGLADPTQEVETGVEKNQTLEENGTAILAGYTRDGRNLGFPLGEVGVSVLGTNRFTLSSNEGRYEFLNVTPGTYRLRFDRTGFVPIEPEVRVERGAINFLNVTLFPPGQKPPSNESAALNPHSHDEWAGATRKLVQQVTFTPPSRYAVDGARWTCIEGFDFPCNIEVPIDVHEPVLPGTTSVEMIARWSTTSPYAPRVMSLGVKTSATGTNAHTLVSRAPGDVYRLAIFPYEADPGHQNFTNFAFLLAPWTGYIYNQKQGLYLIDSITFEVWINKGVVPLEPPHQSFWGPNTTLPLLSHAKKTGSGLNDYPRPEVNDQSGTSRWTLPPDVFVPAGTLELRGRLDWTASTPSLGAQWGLLYKPANFPNSGWGFDELPKAKMENRGATGADIVIPVSAAEADKYYQLSSYWKFYLDDGKAANESLLRLQPNEPNNAVTFDLTLEARKDPASLER